MNIKIQQISSLEKIRCINDIPEKEINKALLMKGESYSYQVAVCTDMMLDMKVKVKSELKECIKLYKVDSAIMDFPGYRDRCDDDLITKDPGSMPDILRPLDIEDNSEWCQSGNVALYWVNVTVPEDFSGMATITFGIDFRYDKKTECAAYAESKLEIEVINKKLPEQELMFTQWFHTDCIADIHNVTVYSEEHWELIDKYMYLAASVGINMILTPVITPPLDTEYGRLRPNTQLLKIEKRGSDYIFDFSNLEKWIALAKKNGIKYFEISHLFSQWGLEYSPNIYITENGVGSYMFGWNVKANDPAYKDFLEQMIPKLRKFLSAAGIEQNCYFHISDEPNENHIEEYTYAKSVVAPLLKDCKIFDALSSIDFYKNGLVTIPVTATDHIEPFLEENIDERWAYYCCGQVQKVGNRFLSMPSYRNRILGIQIYKYNIKGFLHWGYNFYYKRLARGVINPYLTTSAGNGFPSGDSFSVYPYEEGAVPSLRAMVFKEAIEDISVCRALEEYIGREKVIELIDSEAGMNVTFSEYPRNSHYVPNLVHKMKEMLKKL